MQKYGLDFKDVLSATQDTTGASINVFDKVKVTAQIPCSSLIDGMSIEHLISIFLGGKETMSSKERC